MKLTSPRRLRSVYAPPRAYRSPLEHEDARDPQRAHEAQNPLDVEMRVAPPLDRFFLFEAPPEPYDATHAEPRMSCTIGKLDRVARRGTTNEARCERRVPTAHMVGLEIYPHAMHMQHVPHCGWQFDHAWPNWGGCSHWVMGGGVINDACMHGLS